MATARTNRKKRRYFRMLLQSHQSKFQNSAAETLRAPEPCRLCIAPPDNEASCTCIAAETGDSSQLNLLYRGSVSSPQRLLAVSVSVKVNCHNVAKKILTIALSRTLVTGRQKFSYLFLFFICSLARFETV